MLAAFVSGIVASLTPCTIVIIPVLLYRFGLNKDKSIKWVELIQLLVGFITGFFVIASLINVLNSNLIYNISRIVLATTFILLGISQLLGKLTFNSIKSISNPLLLGLLLPIMVNLSPCVLPIFASFIGFGLSINSFILVVAFAFGMLFPAVLVVILGKSMYKLLYKGSAIIGRVERFFGILLVFSGVYLNFQVLNLTRLDIILTIVFFVGLTSFFTYQVFFKNKMFNLANVLMLIAFLILGYIVLHNCYNDVIIYRELVINACGKSYCKVCTKCAKLFTVSTFLGVFGYYMSLKTDFNIKNK